LSISEFLILGVNAKTQRDWRRLDAASVAGLFIATEAIGEEAPKEKRAPTAFDNLSSIRDSFR
jgi:hypothetical protein